MKISFVQWFKSIQSVTFSSITLIFVIGILGIIFPLKFVEFVKKFNQTSLDMAESALLYFSSLIVCVCGVLSLSKHGKLKLGGEDAKPEFSRFSWVCMLFAAGMGAGLVFWGVAEPMAHLNEAIPYAPLGGDQFQKESWSLITTYINWGIHAWSIYAISGLCYAFFYFNKKHSLSVSSPFLGIKLLNHRYSTLVIELMGIVAVVFGIAASLGQGILQLESGIRAFAITEGHGTQLRLLIMIFMMVAYMVSASTKLSSGIKYLSQLNIAIAVALMMVVFFFGSFEAYIGYFFHSSIAYLQHLPNLLFWSPDSAESSKWARNWTISFHNWWIAWSPFVGIFLARISKGRTIREFLLFGVLCPSIFTIMWFSIFGGAGFAASDVLKGVQPEFALFQLLKTMPIASVTQIVALVLIFTFLITSADSASYVVSMMMTKGREDPSQSSKLIWGLLIALLTICTILIPSGLPAMKAVALAGALPFTTILALQIVSLLYYLYSE